MDKNFVKSYLKKGVGKRLSHVSWFGWVFFVGYPYMVMSSIHILCMVMSSLLK